MSDPRQSFGGAKVMIFIGEALLVLRRDLTPGIAWPGRLDFPGGGREGDESPEECALRETFEETGLSLRGSDLVLAQLREDVRGSGWYFAAHLPRGTEDRIRFGNEGLGWLLMAPEAFVAAEDAVPHFRDILRAYLEKKEAGSTD